MRIKIRKPKKYKQQNKCGVCNMCGRSLDCYELQEGLAIHTAVGYGSKYDLSTVHLQLCCDCFDNLVDSCTISPITGSYDFISGMLIQ